MRVAYFTAGTVGAGHLARGLAIERALARAGSRTELATFGPPTTLPIAPHMHAVPLDPAVLADPARAASSPLARALAAFAPDVLLVDLFWAPVRNLLPLAGCEAWLLLRKTSSQWFVGPPGYPYERHRFARVIAIEPGIDPAEVDETIEPIVIANPDERRPPGALRAALGAPFDAPLAVAHQAGEPGEWTQLVAALPRRPVHVFTLGPSRASSPDPDVHVHDGAPFFPLAAWLHDADALASGAGYNAYWEARWMGHDAKTTFVPFPRPIDDQAWRIATCGGHRMRANGADVLASRLR